MEEPKKTKLVEGIIQEIEKIAKKHGHILGKWTWEDNTFINTGGWVAKCKNKKCCACAYTWPRAGYWISGTDKKCKHD